MTLDKEHLSSLFIYKMFWYNFCNVIGVEETRLEARLLAMSCL